MADRVFGHIPGVEVGAIFPDRRSLSQTGVHRPTQAGISGNKTDGADSIVVSGGYRDDKDYGDLIIYTGQGGNDPNTRRQVADQELVRGNIGLVLSCDNGLPVRVVRGAKGDAAYSPEHGYRYDGLFSVTRYWSQPGLDGFLVWQFELCQFSNSVSQVPGLKLPASTETEQNGGPAPRAQGTVQRLVRNTAVGSRVKALHGFACQVCGTCLETLTGQYAEAAHIRPLGRPHNGPDITSNVLCLCPNCHVQFDRLAIYVDEDRIVRQTRTGKEIGVLRSAPKHHVDPEQLAYQKALCRPSTPDDTLIEPGDTVIQLVEHEGEMVPIIWTADEDQ